MARKQKKQSQPILTWNQVLRRRGINFSRTWCAAVGIKSYDDLVRWCDRQHVHPPVFQDVSGAFDVCTSEESVTADVEGHTTVLDLGAIRDEHERVMINNIIQTAVERGVTYELDGEQVPATNFFWSTEVIPHADENEAVIFADITGSSRDLERTWSAAEVVEAADDVDSITAKEIELTDLRNVKRELNSKPKRARTKITEPKQR